MSTFYQLRDEAGYVRANSYNQNQMLSRLAGAVEELCKLCDQQKSELERLQSQVYNLQQSRRA